MTMMNSGQSQEKIMIGGKKRDQEGIMTMNFSHSQEMKRDREDKMAMNLS